MIDDDEFVLALKPGVIVFARPSNPTDSDAAGASRFFPVFSFLLNNTKQLKQQQLQ